jgi:hypothetical protein
MGFPADRPAEYAFPPAASYAFITIGRNKYAGLAAGGEFSVRAVGVWATGDVTC